MLMSSGPLTLKDRSNSVSEHLAISANLSKHMLILFSVTPFCPFPSYEVELSLPEESHGALSSHSFGQQSLSRPRWSTQQDPSPVQIQRQELRTLQRKLNRVQDLLLHMLETADILPAHIRYLLTTRDTKDNVMKQTAASFPCIKLHL